MKRSELRTSWESTRDWQERSRDRALERARGREGMSSSFLRRATAPSDFRGDDGQPLPTPPSPLAFSTLKPGRRKRKVTIPKTVRLAALARSGGLCVVCVRRLKLAGKPVTAAKRAVQLHHVLPERDYPQFAKEADNLVGCCPTCHGEHEDALPRMPRGALPLCVLEFAERAGLYWYIERTYPVDP